MKGDDEDVRLWVFLWCEYPGDYISGPRIYRALLIVRNGGTRASRWTNLIGNQFLDYSLVVGFVLVIISNHKKHCKVLFLCEYRIGL